MCACVRACACLEDRNVYMYVFVCVCVSVCAHMCIVCVWGGGGWTENGD